MKISDARNTTIIRDKAYKIKCHQSQKYILKHSFIK